MSTPFRDALALTEDGDGFAATLGAAWTVGPKAHGGLLVALCAAAARRSLRGEGLEPLVVSASFLAAPDPGPVGLLVHVRKRGRSVSVVEIELHQGSRVAVRAAVTLGLLEDTPPLHETVREGMPVEPSADAIEVAAHASGPMMNVASVCDVRLDRTTATFAAGRDDGRAEIRLWVRPHGEQPDVLFALLAGDVSPPVTLNLGRTGWAPTVQLTALVRAKPAPGWLRVHTSSRCVGGTWFDEDATVTDSTGALVVQSRQLAMMPRPGG